nr:MAG: matrix protein [Lantra virus]UQS95373.1 MAG: matrix protein [Lantra virus]
MSKRQLPKLIRSNRRKENVYDSSRLLHNDVSKHMYLVTADLSIGSRHHIESYKRIIDITHKMTDLYEGPVGMKTITQMILLYLGVTTRQSILDEQSFVYSSLLRDKINFRVFKYEFSTDRSFLWERNVKVKVDEDMYNVYLSIKFQPIMEECMSLHVLFHKDMPQKLIGLQISDLAQNFGVIIIEDHKGWILELKS